MACGTMIPVNAHKNRNQILPALWAAETADEIEQLKASGRWRFLRNISTPQDRIITLDGKRVLNFCSNDYLSLAGSPLLKNAVNEGVELWGAGASASRLISGTMEPHLALEKELADWLGGESCLLFGSGWHANAGVLQALGSDMTVYSDELNHASIIDGIRLAGCNKHIYRHRDMEHLEQLLARAAPGRGIIVTDALFSMDGDSAPLTEICSLAEKFGMLVYVDEAHSTGILGPQGSGLVEALGLQKKVHIRMGTFGKALGLYGAFVVLPDSLRSLLINRARSFIFTTATPPAIAHAVLQSITFARSKQQTVQIQLQRIKQLAKEIATLGFETSVPDGPILPIQIGENQETMDACTTLLDAGIFVQGIRPPTVAEGSSRLRLTVQLSHTENDLQALLAGLGSLKQ